MPNFVVRTDFKTGTPGNVCYLCKTCQRVDHAGVREVVVDPGIHIEWEGPLNFCASCVAEMGTAIGMVSVARVNASAAAARLASADAAFARAQAADLRIAVAALTRAGYTPAPDQVEPEPLPEPLPVAAVPRPAHSPGRGIAGPRPRPARTR